MPDDEHPGRSELEYARDKIGALGRDLKLSLAEQDRLVGQLNALHSWAGLMSLLDEHYPAQIFTGESGDEGPRVVALIRAVDSLTAMLERMDTQHTTFSGPDGKEIHPHWCRECRVSELKAAIADIDAHATPVGLLNNDDPDGSPHHYLLTVGALHRALGKAHTAEPCESERARLRVEVDRLRREVEFEGKPEEFYWSPPSPTDLCCCATDEQAAQLGPRFSRPVCAVHRQPRVFPVGSPEPVDVLCVQSSVNGVIFQHWPNMGQWRAMEDSGGNGDFYYWRRMNAGADGAEMVELLERAPGGAT